MDSNFALEELPGFKIAAENRLGWEVELKDKPDESSQGFAAAEAATKKSINNTFVFDTTIIRL